MKGGHQNHCRNIMKVGKKGTTSNNKVITKKGKNLRYREARILFFF